MEDMEDIISMLKYFWEENEDLESWTYYEDNLDQLKKEHPEIIAAWENYKASKKALNNILKLL
jgi:hypothetical protein